MNTQQKEYNEMTTATSTFPPVICEPWCETGDGHPGQNPDDQRCMGESRFVALSQDTPVLDSDDKLTMSTLEMYVEQSPTGSPQVSVSRDGLNVALLTMGEAESLRNALTALLAETH